MMYKDRTWCITNDCTNTKCTRNFTKEERVKATEWWGNENFLLSVTPLKGTEMCEGYENG